MRGLVGPGDLRGGPHRLGAYSCAHRLSSGLPADGWLRVLCTCVEIGQDWFDEDHIVVDRLGRIVVQTRQLAMVPAQ